MYVRETGCCGVLELVDISTIIKPEDVVKKTLEEMVHLTRTFSRRKPFIYFTSVVKRAIEDHASDRKDDYGLALAAHIEEHQLGEVVSTLPERANFSGNVIKMWLWVPDYDALAVLWADRERKRIASLDALVAKEATKSAESLWATNTLCYTTSKIAGS